jgi:hypothetical protein
MTKTEIISNVNGMISQLSIIKAILLNEEIEPEEFIDYDVNWAKAPDWALAHAYDENGEGFWYGPHIVSTGKRFASYEPSGWQIGSSVMEIHKKTWKNSITEKDIIF